MDDAILRTWIKSSQMSGSSFGNDQLFTREGKVLQLVKGQVCALWTTSAQFCERPAFCLWITSASFRERQTFHVVNKRPFWWKAGLSLQGVRSDLWTSGFSICEKPICEKPTTFVNYQLFASWTTSSWFCGKQALRFVSDLPFHSKGQRFTFVNYLFFIPWTNSSLFCERLLILRMTGS